MTRLIPPLDNIAQGIYEVSSIRMHNLGDRVTSEDGRKWVYVKAGATALIGGTLQQGPVPIANHSNMTASTQSVGDRLITVTLGATAVTANQYRRSYVFINAGTGVGYYYNVAYHPAASAGATVQLVLEDAIQVATNTATAKATLMINPYNGANQCPTTLTAGIIGLANAPIAASSYGWLQTFGPAPALVRGTSGGTAVGISQSLVPSANTAGTLEVEVQSTGVVRAGSVGYAMGAGTTSATPQATGIFLTLD